MAHFLVKIFRPKIKTKICDQSKAGSLEFALRQTPAPTGTASRQDFMLSGGNGQSLITPKAVMCKGLQPMQETST